MTANDKSSKQPILCAAMPCPLTLLHWLRPPDSIKRLPGPSDTKPNHSEDTNPRQSTPPTCLSIFWPHLPRVRGGPMPHGHRFCRYVNRSKTLR
jgi:hypothetical protein